MLEACCRASIDALRLAETAVIEAERNRDKPVATPPPPPADLLLP